MFMNRQISINGDRNQKSLFLFGVYNICDETHGGGGMSGLLAVFYILIWMVVLS